MRLCQGLLLQSCKFHVVDIMSMLTHFGYFINMSLESEDIEDVGLVEEATKGKALLVLTGLNDDSYDNTSFPPGELIQLNGRQNGALTCNDSFSYPGPGSLHSATGGLVFGGIPLICGGAVRFDSKKNLYYLGQCFFKQDFVEQSHQRLFHSWRHKSCG